MSEDLEWLKSKCIGTWLHDYKIFKVTPTYVHEICTRCADEVAFTIINGKTDNMDYLDYHLRNALPKWHPIYHAEYPKK